MLCSDPTNAAGPDPLARGITQCVKDTLTQHTYLTGSKAYGLSRPQDEDRYCDYEAYAQIASMLEGCGIVATRAPYLDGLYFELDGTRYNVFPLPRAELAVFDVVTNCLRAMERARPGCLSDKTRRVMLFNMLRAAVKSWDPAELSGAFTDLANTPAGTHVAAETGASA